MGKITITNDFLDKTLTVEILKKYRTNENDHYFDQKYIDWAYENLIGYTRYQASYVMSIKHDELMRIGRRDRDYTQCNEFTKVMHCIDYEMGHDYKILDEVEYWSSPKKTKRSYIQKVLDRNMVMIDDAVISIDLIITNEPLPPIQRLDVTGQISFF